MANSRSARIALLLGLGLMFSYGPVLGAGFLNYDDPWLIQNNPYYAPGILRTPWVSFTDFSFATRMALGAEYLPLRDILGFLETRAFGIWAPGMRTVSVLLYAAACLLLRGALLRTLGEVRPKPAFLADVAVLAFAFHPVHVESVAWLAGQKDVLALSFIAGALYVHAGDGEKKRALVPLLVLAACLSKSMSVAVVVLIAAQDYLKQRRPDPVLYGASCAAIALTMAAHLYVGRVVGMVTAPAGGSRYTALITMGPVWLRYLQNSLWPLELSIAYDVKDRVQWDAFSVLGTLFVLGALSACIVLHRRGQRLFPFAFAWFFGPLLPVSQVIAPLQNRMADRYLWLSVLAPCLLVGAALHALAEQRTTQRLRSVATPLACALCLGLCALSFERSVVFSESTLLFADATGKTVLDTDAPYQLGKALEDEGRNLEAELAYREVIARSPPGPVADARRAANNLARLLARRGQLVEAERVLRAALDRFPHDAKVRGNLAKVLRGMGRDAEARTLENN